jgi:hypothetical protein
MAGFGTQKAGTSSAGYGPGGTATVQGGAMLQDSTGAVTCARKIDPRTRDYALDTNKRLAGMDPVQQIVHLCAHTESASSAVQALGQSLRDLKVVSPNFKAAILDKLTEALRDPISRGLVEIIDFTDFRAGAAGGLQPGQVYGRLRWRDLTTGQEHTETI